MERTKKISENLIRLRGNRTQAEVAKALGIASSTYAMYELGQRTPSDEVKIRIAEYYNRSVQFIFFSR